MKLTNKFNLPETIINVIKRPTYSKGKAHISVTELMTAPQIVLLKRQHWNEIEQDASEMVWQIFGSAIHGVLEHGKSENHVIEQRIHAKVDGWDISGAIDLQENTPEGIIISDYKTTGAWAVMNEKDEWHQQLNVYAWLVDNVKNDKVIKLQIIAIIRDWSAKEAQNKEGYPQSPIVTIDIPLWTMDERLAYIKRRIKMHSDAQFNIDMGDPIPECGEKDMWEKPTTWALIKEGGVRAKRVYDNEAEAKTALIKGYIIEHRPGERTRCKSYCQVSQFCNQYQTYLKEQQNG
jgi:hypothetical protein